jgi:hypothetical protein
LFASAFSSIDHDEGQYVGAVALMRHGLPYRDFAYLQTPLQPLLFAPLAWVAEGWLFPALRAINALLGAGAVAMLWLAARRAGASSNGARIAAIALASSAMLLFAASVARNDALPLLLHVIGLWLLLAALQRQSKSPLLFLAGLALGAAASAKISYGLPAAAAGLFALLRWHTLRPAAIMAFALGGLLGGTPTAFLWALAPEAAHFGIFDYSLKAPFEWRILNGQASMLAAPLSFARLLRYLAEGCGLVALAATAFSRLHGHKHENRDITLLLDLMIAAGLLAAWLPRPIYIQYLGPLLPALFVRFALLVDAPFWRRPIALSLLALSMIAGCVPTALDVAQNIANGDSPQQNIRRDARAIGVILHGQQPSDQIATLSPERMVDSGLTLDRRFVTGPFLFRTRDILKPSEAEALHVATARTAGAALDAQPPIALLVGAEMKGSPAAPQGLDATLILWARAHGYRPITLPSATASLYIRPDIKL